MKITLNVLILQSFRIQQMLNKNERNALKIDAPQSEYDVVISVLNPRPDIMDVKWNVKLAAESKFVCLINLNCYQL